MRSGSAKWKCEVRTLGSVFGVLEFGFHVTTPNPALLTPHSALELRTPALRTSHPALFFLLPTYYWLLPFVF